MHDVKAGQKVQRQGRCLIVVLSSLLLRAARCGLKMVVRCRKISTVIRPPSPFTYGLCLFSC